MNKKMTVLIVVAIILGLIVILILKGGVGKLSYTELEAVHESTAPQIADIQETFEAAINPDVEDYIDIARQYEGAQINVEIQTVALEDCKRNEENPNICDENLDNAVKDMEDSWFEIEESDETLIEYAETAKKDMEEISSNLSLLRTESELQSYLDAMVAFVDSYIAYYDDFINLVNEYETLNADNFDDFYDTLDLHNTYISNAYNLVYTTKEIAYNADRLSNIKSDR